MKLFMSVLFATLALNGVLSLPARTEDAEVIDGPRRTLIRADNDDSADSGDDDFKTFKGFIDTGSGYPFLQPNPSVVRVGFFDSFDDLFRRFSERLFPTGFLSRAGVDSDEDNSKEIGFPAIDTKKANRTSTVKVVDGHKVEVNETVYGDENSVFKIRMVNIRPLDDGEVVEEAEHKDIKPVTQGPNEKTPADESNESNETREPLEKKPAENEIQGNIDEPEENKHSIVKKENIVETTEVTTATTTIYTTMLPTTEDIDAVFVTENGLEQQEYSTLAVAEEELNGDNGNGNNEFETNMSEESNNSNNNGSDDNIDNVENLKVEHTIENNEDTEEEVNDNLNESSSSGNVDVSDKEQENNDSNDEDSVDVVDGDETKFDIDNINLKNRNSNYLTAIRHKEREGESSSDDEDANDASVELHPVFHEEWDSLNKPTNKQNLVEIDLSNDIAVNYLTKLPLNPDAESIYVEHPSNTLPKFVEVSSDYQSPFAHNENLKKVSSRDNDASIASPEFKEDWNNLNKPSNEQNEFNENYDAYYPLPIDLSHDTDVNNTPNLPLNPDAEFIDVYGVQHSSNSMAKIEKHSFDHQPPSAEYWTNAPTK